MKPRRRLKEMLCIARLRSLRCQETVTRPLRFSQPIYRNGYHQRHRQLLFEML